MKKEVENEEIKDLKNKYKKLKYSIIITLVFIVLVVLTYFTYNVLMVQQLLKKNVPIKYGDNYKKTMTSYYMNNPEEKTGSIVYRKGEITKVNLKNGKFGMLKTPENSYQIMYETKEYVVLNSDIHIEGSAGENNLLTYCLIDDINSFMSVAEFVYRANVRYGKEEIDGVTYYVLNIKGFEQKIYVNAENNLVERQEYNGYVLEIKVEKDVVTDEDVKLPQDMGYTYITDTVN